MAMERFIIPGKREEGNDLKPVLVCERYENEEGFKCTFYEDSRDGEPVAPIMSIVNEEMGTVEIRSRRPELDAVLNPGVVGEQHWVRRIDLGWW